MRRHYIKVPVTFVPLDDVIGTIHEESYDLDLMPDNVEYLVFRLSTAEVEILTLKFMGYTSQEISDVMNFKNIQSYYQLSHKLRKNTALLINNR